MITDIWKPTSGIPLDPGWIHLIMGHQMTIWQDLLFNSPSEPIAWALQWSPRSLSARCMSEPQKKKISTDVAQTTSRETSTPASSPESAPQATHLQRGLRHLTPFLLLCMLFLQKPFHQNVSLMSLNFCFILFLMLWHNLNFITFIETSRKHKPWQHLWNNSLNHLTPKGNSCDAVFISDT